MIHSSTKGNQLENGEDHKNKFTPTNLLISITINKKKKPKLCYKKEQALMEQKH